MATEELYIHKLKYLCENRLSGQTTSSTIHDSTVYGRQEHVVVTKSGRLSEKQELEQQMEKASTMVQATIGRMLHDQDIHPHLVVLSMAKVTGELMGVLAAASGTDLEEVLCDTPEIVHQAARNHYDAIQALNAELMLQSVASRYGRSRRRWIEALGYDPRLLLHAPAAPAADPGDHLEPAKAVGVGTSRTTMITHSSRPVLFSSGPLSSPLSANPQGGAQATLTKEARGKAISATSTVITLQLE